MPKIRNPSQSPLVDLDVEEIMSKSPRWLNMAGKILLVDLLITIFVAGWSWLTKDFGSLSLSNRFFIGGVIVVLISLASGLGNFQNRSDWKQLLAQSAGQANLNERTQRMMADMLQVYGLAFVMVPAGLIAILIAVFLGQLT
jgi:hypothetical protein